MKGTRTGLDFMNLNPGKAMQLSVTNLDAHASSSFIITKSSNV